MGSKIYGSLFLLLVSAANANQREYVLPGIEANVLGCCQGILAPPRPTQCGGYAEADFLYWVPHEEGLEYAFKQNSPSGDTDDALYDPLLAATTIDGRFNRIDFNWQAAFRLEAGYTLPIDDWTVFARWTRLKEKVCSHSGIDSLAHENISAIWLGAEFFELGYSRVLDANATWALHYNVLDGGLSRTFHWGSRLLLTPQAGIRGFWINQRFAVDYSGGDVTQSPANFKGINNFDGAGFFGQLNTQWFFHRHWSILGEFLSSVNFGRLKLAQQTSSQIQDAAAAPIRDAIHQVLHRTRFAYQAAIGLEWLTYFNECVNERKVAFCLKYELSEWLHINQLRRFAYSDNGSVANFIPMEGTLGFQGISFTGRFDY